MPDTNPQTEIFNSATDPLGLVNAALRGWNQTTLPKDLPFASGLYAIFNEVGGTCLYVGQSENLQKRILHHWAWRQAYYVCDLPRITYKVIERETIEQTRRELIYNECLLIGLFRPDWNAAVPAPRSDFMPAKSEKLKEIHWSKLAEIKFEPFHQAMLSSEGYRIPKQVKVMTVSGSVMTKWRRVLYDKDYVDMFLKDLANQIDAFFLTCEFYQSKLLLESDDPYLNATTD